MKKHEFEHVFRETHQRFSRYYHHLLLTLDISLPQYTLLCLLIWQPQASMTELSTRLYLTKPAITNLVDRLVHKGMLRRCPDCNDRRICYITITAKGRRLVTKMQAHSLELILTAFNHMNARSQSVITDFYRTISTTMDERAPSYGK